MLPIIALFFFVGLPIASSKLYTEDVSMQKNLWEDYKRDFARTYESHHEESTRFSAFVENLKWIDHLQSEEIQAGGSATYGITRFIDMSQVIMLSHYQLEVLDFMTCIL